MDFRWILALSWMVAWPTLAYYLGLHFGLEVSHETPFLLVMSATGGFLVPWVGVAGAILNIEF